MNQVERIVRIISAVYLLIVVAFSSFVVNAIQALVTVCPIIPYTKRVAICQQLANTWWPLFPYIVEVWGQVKYRFTGDRLSGAENAVIICNHESGIDFTNGIAVSTRVPEIGCGRMMAFMKESLKYIPTIGWTQYLQGSLYLKRNWEKDRVAITQKLQEMENGVFPRPFWIGVYPEGTRITPKKKAESQEFAKSRGLPVLNNVLLPRTKGFVFLKQQLPSSIDAIYDVTLCYTGSPCYLGDAFMSGIFKSKGVNVHIRRIPFKTLPSDEAGVEKWLVDTFAEKDKLLENFKKDQAFPGPEVEYPSQLNDFFTCFLGWSLLMCGALAASLGLLSIPSALSIVLTGVHAHLSLGFITKQVEDKAKASTAVGKKSN